MEASLGGVNAASMSEAWCAVQLFQECGSRASGDDGRRRREEWAGENPTQACSVEVVVQKDGSARSRKSFD